MQSIINDANISILNVSVLDSVIGIEAKTKETSGEVAGTDFNLGTRKKQEGYFQGDAASSQETEKEAEQGGGGGCWAEERGGGSGGRLFVRSCEGQKGARGRSSRVGLYRLVASATLPPANQVRDKHKDD